MQSVSQSWCMRMAAGCLHRASAKHFHYLSRLPRLTPSNHCTPQAAHRKPPQSGISTTSLTLCRKSPAAGRSEGGDKSRTAVVTDKSAVAAETVSGKDSPGVEEDRPTDAVKYTESEAGLWKSRYTFTGPDDEHQKLEREYFIRNSIISLSAAAFIIYYGFLREENDIDLELRILEKLSEEAAFIRAAKLRQALVIAEERNLETKGIEEKLAAAEEEIAAHRREFILERERLLGRAPAAAS